MANTLNGVTIDVSARITGYLSDLEKFKKAVLNVDPSSQVGKALGKMLSDYERRVESISKNSLITVFSDRLLDSALEKMNNIDRLGVTIGQTLSGIKTDNLNFSGIAGEMQTILTSISAVLAELTGLENIKIGSLLKDAPALADALREMGVNLENASLKDVLKTLGASMASATKEVENYTEQLKLARAAQDELESKKTSHKETAPAFLRLTNEEFANGMSKMLSGLKTDGIIDEGAMQKLADLFTSNLSNALAASAKDGKVDEGLKTVVEGLLKLITDAFSSKNFDPEKFKSTMENVFSVIRDTKGLTKSGMLGEGFNKNTSIRLILARFFDEGAISEYKTKAEEVKSIFANFISPATLMKLLESIDSGDFENFSKTLVTALERARENFTKEETKFEKEIEDGAKRIVTIELKLTDAKDKQSTTSTVSSGVEGAVKNLTDRIAELERKLLQLLSKRDAAAADTQKKTLQWGNEAANNSANRLSEAKSMAEEYHKALSLVGAAERGLGSLLSLIGRWFSVYGAINMCRRAVRSMIDDITLLDKTINLISIVTTFSMDELWAQIPKYTEMAQKYGVAISGVYEVSQLYYQLGLLTAQVTELTSSTLQLAKISGLDYSTATNYMTNAVRSFKMEMSEATTVTDAYAALAASSASSVQELATAMSKTASSAQAVGMTMQETSAMMAVMIEATREAPENIGSAMKSIISRYGEMTSDPSKLMDSEGLEMSLNKVDKALLTVGISLHDAQGQFRSFSEVITELAAKWDGLSSNTQRYIATVMAGNRQQSRFLALVSSGERLAQLTNVANNSEGTGLLQTLKTMDTIDTKAQLVKTALLEIYNSLGLLDVIKGWYDWEKAIAKFYARVALIGQVNFVGTLLLLFVSLASALKSIFGVIKAVVVAHSRTAQAEMTHDVLTQYQLRVMYYRDEGKSEIEAKRLAVLEFKNLEMSKNGTVSTRTSAFKWGSSKGANVARTAGAIGGAVLSIAGTAVASSAALMDELTLEQRNSKATLTSVSGALLGAGTGLSMGSAFGPWGMIAGTVIGGIVGLVTSAGTAAEIALETTTERLDRLKNDYEKKNNKALEAKSEADSLKNLKTQYDQLYKSRNTSNEAMLEYLNLCNEIAGTHSELIAGYDSEGNAIINMSSAYDRLYESLRRAYLMALSQALAAGYTYETDPAVIASEYIGDIHLDRNATGEGLIEDYDFMTDAVFGLFLWGLWGLTGALAETALAHAYEVALDAILSDNPATGSLAIGSALWEQTRVAGRGQPGLLILNLAVGNNNLWNAENAANYNRAISEAMGLDEVVDFITYNPEDNTINATNAASEAIGLGFISRYGNANVQLATRQINEVLESYGLNEAFYFSEDYVRFLLGAARTAGSFNAQQRSNQLLEEHVHSMVTDIMDGSTEYSGIERVAYEELIVNSILELMNGEEHLSGDEAWTRVMTDAINNGSLYGIDAVLSQNTELLSLSRRRKLQASELWDSVAQYNEDEFEAALDALGLANDSELRASIIRHRNEVTRDSKQRFHDLFATDLTYFSDAAADRVVSRDGIISATETTILDEGTLARWVGRYDDASELWLGGFFSPLILDNIGNLFKEIVDNTALSTHTRSLMIEATRSLYNNIIEAVESGLLTSALGQEISRKVSLADLSTVLGIYDLAEELETYGISLDDVNGIGASLKQLLDSIQINLFTEINTYLNTIGNKVKEFSSAMKKGFEGMDFDDAIKLATELGIEFNSDNFLFKGGKFYFTDINTMVGHYIDDIKETRDLMLRELEEDSQFILNSLNHLRSILLSSGDDNWFDTPFGRKRLGDIITEAQGLISENYSWTDVFSRYHIDNQQLSRELQIHLELFDEFGDTSLTFYEWLQDNNNVWSAWNRNYKSTHGDVASIQLLSAMTGLTDDEATQIASELSSAWDEWAQMAAEDKRRYNYVFLAYARESIQALRSSYDFANETFNYLVALLSILLDGIETFWDYDTVILDWMNAHPGISSTVKTNTIRALRNNEWDNIMNSSFLSLDVKDELLKFGDLFYQNYLNLVKDGFTSMAASITDGALVIKINSANRNLLINWGTNVAGERLTEETIDNYTSAILDLTGATLENLNSFLNDVLAESGLKGKTRVDTIAAIQKAIGERSVKHVMSLIVNTYDSFTYEVASAFAQMVGETVEVLAAEGGPLIYDAILGTYSIRSPLELLNYLNTKGIVLDAELQAQLMQHLYELSLESSINAILKNYNSIASNVLGTFAQLSNMNFDTLIERFGIELNADGTYRIELLRLRELIAMNRSHLRDEEYARIEEQLVSLYDTVISEVTNIPNSMRQGFTKTVDMLKYVDMINLSGLFELTFTMLGLNGLFEWNENLHAYTYSTLGLIAQIQYFYDLLDLMTEELREATQQLLKDNVRLLAAAIDIKGYLSSGRTNEDWAAIGEAYDAYVLYVETLNLLIRRRNLLLQLLLQLQEQSLREQRGIGQTGMITLSSDMFEAEYALLGTIENDIFSAYTQEEFRGLIEAGGAVAVEAVNEIYKAAGKVLTAEDARSVFRAEISRFTDTVSQQLTATTGDIVDKATYNILNGISGYTFDSRLAEQGIYLITSVGNNLEAVYRAYFNALQETNEATLKELNDAQANILANSSEWGRGELTAIDLLSKATSVTYTELAEFFTSMGWEFSEQSMNILREQGIIEARGGNRVAITDWRALAELAGYDFNSPEYVAGLSAYNDAIIKMNETVEDLIEDEIGKLTSANRGDLLNLTYFINQLASQSLLSFNELASERRQNGSNTATLDDYYSYLDYGITLLIGNELMRYGAYLNDGILYLADNANLYGIIQTIKNRGELAGILAADQVAELADALVEMVDNFVNLIKEGITGSLSNTDILDLQNSMAQFGISTPLNFVPTTEGLLLSTKSMIDLYNGLRNVNALAAQGIFDELVSHLLDANTELKTMPGVMRLIRDLNNEILTLGANGAEAEQERLATLQAELAVYEQMAHYMQLNLPESYKLFEAGSAYSGVLGYSNFINSFAGINQVLYQAGKDGYMQWADFERWARGMTDLAVSTGEDVVSCGVTFDQAGTQYANLMAHANVLITLDGKTIVNLTNLPGILFDASAALAQSGENLSAIQTYALRQVEMLDSIIHVLEIVAAMEELGDLDINGDHSLDVSEIFTFNGDTITGYAPQVNQTATDILAIVDANENLKTAFEQFKIGTHNLYEIMQAMQSGDPQRLLNLFDGDQNAVTAVLNWLLQSGFLNWDNPDEAMAQLREMAARDLGELPVEWTINGIKYIITADGNIALVNEAEFDAQARAIMSRHGNDLDAARRAVLRAFLLSINELWLRGDTEALAIRLSNDSNSAVRRSENGYTISVGGRTFNWPQDEDAFLKAIAAERYLLNLTPGHSLGEITVDGEGENLSFTVNKPMTDDLTFIIGLNEQNNGVQYTTTYHGLNFTGTSEEDLINQMYNYDREHDSEYINDDSADSYQYNKRWRMSVLGQTEAEISNEFTADAVRSITGLRTALFEAWQGRGEMTWLQFLEDELGESLIENYGFDLSELDGWGDLATLLNFEETSVSIEGTFTGAQAANVAYLLEHIRLGGGSLGVAKIQVTTETINGQTVNTGVTWYNENNEPIEPNNIEDRAYALRITYIGEGDDAEILAVERLAADGTVSALINYSEDGSHPTLDTLARLINDSGLIPITIHYEEDNSGQSLTIATYQADNGGLITVTYDDSTGHIQKMEYYDANGGTISINYDESSATLTISLYDPATGNRTMPIAVHYDEGDGPPLSLADALEFIIAHPEGATIGFSNIPINDLTLTALSYLNNILTGRASGIITASVRGIVTETITVNGINPLTSAINNLSVAINELYGRNTPPTENPPAENPPIDAGRDNSPVRELSSEEDVISAAELSWIKGNRGVDISQADFITFLRDYAVEIDGVDAAFDALHDFDNPTEGARITAGGVNFLYYDGKWMLQRVAEALILAVEAAEAAAAEAAAARRLADADLTAGTNKHDEDMRITGQREAENLLNTGTERARAAAAAEAEARAFREALQAILAGLDADYDYVTSNGENYIRATADGGFDLYYNGASTPRHFTWDDNRHGFSLADNPSTWATYQLTSNPDGSVTWTELNGPRRGTSYTGTGRITAQRASALSTGMHEYELAMAEALKNDTTLDYERYLYGDDGAYIGRIMHMMSGRYLYIPETEEGRRIADAINNNIAITEDLGILTIADSLGPIQLTLESGLREVELAVLDVEEAISDTALAVIQGAADSSGQGNGAFVSSGSRLVLPSAARGISVEHNRSFSSIQAPTSFVGLTIQASDGTTYYILEGLTFDNAKPGEQLAISETALNAILSGHITNPDTGETQALSAMSSDPLTSARGYDQLLTMGIVRDNEIVRTGNFWSQGISGDVYRVRLNITAGEGREGDEATVLDSNGESFKYNSAYGYGVQIGPNQLISLRRMVAAGGLFERRDDSTYVRARRSPTLEDYAEMYEYDGTGTADSWLQSALAMQSYVAVIAATAENILDPYAEAIRRIDPDSSKRNAIKDFLIESDTLTVDSIRGFINDSGIFDGMRADVIQALINDVLENPEYSSQILDARSLDDFAALRLVYGNGSTFVGLGSTIDAYLRAMTSVLSLSGTNYNPNITYNDDQERSIQFEDRLVSLEGIITALLDNDQTALESALTNANFLTLELAATALDAAAFLLQGAADDFLDGKVLEFRVNEGGTQRMTVNTPDGRELIATTGVVRFSEIPRMLNESITDATSFMNAMRNQDALLQLGESDYFYDFMTGKVFTSNASDANRVEENAQVITDALNNDYYETTISVDMPELFSAIQQIIDNRELPQEVAVTLDPEEIRIVITIEGNGATADTSDDTITVEESSAHGNIALAKGRGTLMGELGPELVVSNGRYFTVGNNGAEFVNLDDDAIVFNHLLTLRLLANGHSSRGKAVNGERKATSFAKGNAMANASSALSTLKALRNMWLNLAETGLSEFALKAGGGGGGGDKNNAGYIADLERWYTLLRKISTLEKEITHLETLRSKLEKDRIIDGKAYYESQKESIRLLEDEIAKKHELVNLQKSYYDARRADLASSKYSNFFTFDEKGTMIYNDLAVLGAGTLYESRGGLLGLAMLNAQNADNSPVYTAQELYEILKAWGFEEDMRYDKSGKEIDMSKDEGYTNAVKAFWDKIDGWKEELDDLYDGFTDYQKDVLDLEGKYNELLLKIIDNQVSLENRIEKAIEDARLREIDEAKSQKDAIQKSTESFIKGLSDSLEKERKMYENSLSDNELNRLRRLLAILLRSGGSASLIRSLQQDITSREQDLYFNALQDLIDAILKASDAEMERLDHLISIMEESLKYEKEHGLLWDLVYEVMNSTPEEIELFLLENSKDLEGKSTLQIAEDLRSIKSEIEQWIGYRDDTDNPINAEPYHNWNTYYEAAKSAYHLNENTDSNIINAAKNAYELIYNETGDENAAARAADEIFYKLFGDRPGAHAIAENLGRTASSTTTGGSSRGGGTSGTVDFYHYYDGICTNRDRRLSNKAPGTYLVTAADYVLKDGYTFSRANPSEYTVRAGESTRVNIYYVSLTTNSSDTPTRRLGLLPDEVRPPVPLRYSSGGLADYTGLAIVHGTPQDPEAFLNAEETHMWRDQILSGNSGSLTSMLLDFQDMVSGMVSSDSYSEIGMSGSGINIENATVNMNATISNDYDARRAADTVMEEMVRIARKTTAQQARR